MSTVSIHLGQCGIQLAPDIQPAGFETMLVDSEPRVLQRWRAHHQRTASNVPGPSWSPVVQLDQGGFANNWACGYSAARFESLMMDSHRRLLERCDYYLGSVLVHSTAGGTGSGLCSRTLETFRDLYPKNYLLNMAVLPFDSGETPMQYYNTSLCLASIQNFSDGCLLMSNQIWFDRIGKSKSLPFGYSGFFGGINYHLTRLMSGIIYPVTLPSVLEKSGEINTDFNGWHLINSLTHTARFFDGVSSDYIYELPRLCISGKCTAAQLYLRTRDRLSTVLDYQNHFKSKIKFVHWNPKPLDVIICPQKRGILTSKTEVNSTPEYTFLYNSNVYFLEMQQRLEKILLRQLSKKAYLHCFQRYFKEHEMKIILQDSMDTLNYATNLYSRLDL